MIFGPVSKNEQSRIKKGLVLFSHQPLATFQKKCLVRSESSVMMTTGSMNMTMIQLFRSCIPDVGNFNIKVQGNAGHRVVAIQNDIVIFNVYHRHQLHTFRRLRLKLHPRQNFINTFKSFARYRLNQIIVPLTVAISRSNGHLEAVTNSLSLQRFFKTGYNVANSMNVGKGLLSTRTVKDFAFLVSQGVVDVDYLI